LVLEGPACAGIVGHGHDLYLVELIGQLAAVGGDTVAESSQTGAGAGRCTTDPIVRDLDQSDPVPGADGLVVVVEREGEHAEDLAGRRLAIIRLHAEGWTVTSIAAYSRSQDLTPYLMVLYAAIRQHGCPEALVSDSGGIFRAKHAVAIYAALGIRKEQIAKRQPWQSLIEPNFGVQRRMSDYHFARAATWEELVAVHQRWWDDFNVQAHWAQRDLPRVQLSPAMVLADATGTRH